MQCSKGKKYGINMNLLEKVCKYGRRKCLRYLFGETGEIARKFETQKFV